MRKVAMVAMAIASAACGGGTRGADTPEAAVSALLEAARARDAEKAMTVFPSAEVLAEYLDCPAEAPLLRRVSRAREEVASALGPLSETQLVRRDAGNDEEKLFKAGDVVDACTAKKDLTSLRTTIVVNVAGRDDGDVTPFMRLGERWYLVSF